MSTTVFHCILCPHEADGKRPEFATGTALRMRQTQRLLGTHATIIQWDVVDANGRIVGHAQTVTGRGGV